MNAKQQDNEIVSLNQGSVSHWRRALRTFRTHPTGPLGLMGVMIIVLSAIFAPYLTSYDPIDNDYSTLLQPPSNDHLLGTDNLGRDMLTRILWGGRESLRVAFLGMTIAISGGTVMGLVSAFYGGLVDNILMRFVDVWMAFPLILLLLSIVSILGPGLTTIIIALGAASIPIYGRIVRGSVLSIKNLDYVLAARSIGASDLGIMFRHILPNMISILIVYASLEIGGFIIFTAGLSFLGLGAQPPTPEWGDMLNDSRDFLSIGPWMSLAPGGAIFATVLCINMLGDGLRDALDPRLKQGAGLQ